MNYPNFLSIALAFAAGSGCGEQRGSVEKVDAPHFDNHPPVFIGKPEIVAVGAKNAQILFAFNEKSTGTLVVRREPELTLTHADIENAEDRYSVDAKAYETIRVVFQDLLPDQNYMVYLTARDVSDNKLEQPVAVSFQTKMDGSSLALAGTPPVAKQGVRWDFRPKNIPEHCTLAIVQSPVWVHIEPDGKTLSGIPQWTIGQDAVEVSVRLVGDGCQGLGSFSVATVGDSLFDYAWHINPKANSVSWFGSPPIIDTGLEVLYQHGLSGNGVSIVVVDSGMQIDHPDLLNNVDFENNVNLDPLTSFNCQVCDPHDTTPPRAPGQPGDQGTAVAGIIAAEGWNGQGSRGVATQAKISAYNLSAQRLTASDNDYLRIFSLKADVVCHSATENERLLTESVTFDFDTYDSAQKSRVHLGRDGKGQIFIKAAGDLHHRKGSAALDQRNVTSWGIVVGAHNSLGQKSRDANAGANLWISAPGGEAGYQGDYRVFDNRLPAIHFYPSIVAPDIFNDEFPCSVGFAKSTKYFASELEINPSLHGAGHSAGFNLGWHDQNPDCRYTATVAPSPAAAGVVAGTVALLLEANPSLTWRDVKYILAKSAQPIDAFRAAEVTSVVGSLYEKTLPWITNAAGYRFHNWYGFGALDAAAALAMVKANKVPKRTPLFDTNWILADPNSLRIPPASIAGVFSDFFSVHDLLVESVQVRINISHENISHLGVELISPNGTRSLLKPIQDGAVFANMEDMIFLSNAFYGERSRGNWQLRIVDGKEGARPGDLTSWYIRITGHKPTGETQ